MTEMNKEKFLKFVINEIECNQKDMYKTGEGKRIVEILTQIYTLTSDGKFDFPRFRDVEIKQEIDCVKADRDSKNYNDGQFLGQYCNKKCSSLHIREFEGNVNCNIMDH